MSPTPGDSVKVHYRGTETATGAEFDSSAGREPLEFIVGAGMVIPGFDAAVAALAVGEKVTVNIPADEAYGPYYDEAVHEMPAEFFGGNLPEEGWAVQLQAENGQVMPATVVSVTEEAAVLDLNHPLAGKDLTFEIELVEFTEGELPAGFGEGGCGCGCGCDDEDDAESDSNCSDGGCGSGCGC